MNETLTAVVQGAVVIVALVLGVRAGGMGLGLWGAAGTAVLVFIMGDAPGDAPVAAFFIIIAVITASATMQAAGGIDFLVEIASKIIRKSPRRITFVAPIVSFFFTMGAGTSNIFFSLIPVIYATSYSAGVRPERPLSVSNIATGFGLTASPVAAAMAAFLALVQTSDNPVSLAQIIAVTLPAGLLATIAGSLVMNKRGKELKDDPEYQRRLAAGKVAPPSDPGSFQLKPRAALSAYVFLAGVALIVVMGLWDNLRPEVVLGDGSTAPMGMTETIALIMLSVALIIMVVNKVNPNDIVRQPLISSGLVAAIALLGLAWMTATYLANNPIVVSSIGDVVERYPYFLAVAVFIVAALTTSQSGTTNAIVPIGLASLGVPTVVAMWPSLVGVYLLPANGTQLASVAIDETGTTRLTKNPLIHSFTIPLFVGWFAVVATGLLFARFL